MANRQRGEVALEMDGKTYTLVFDMNALCCLEDLFSTPEREVVFQDVLKMASKGSARHIRGIVWASLQRHHPEVSLSQSTDLIEAAGGFEGFGEKLQQLADSTQPDPEDRGRPRKAQRNGGTGVTATSRLAASA